MEMPPGAAPPPNRPIAHYELRVRLPAHESGVLSAIAVTKDGKFIHAMPAGHVARRFGPGETVAYFKATIQDGIVELGDRFEPKERW